MTDLRTVARAWSRHQASVAQLAANRAAAIWTTLDRTDLSGSWGANAGPSLARLLAAAQRLAAAGAGDYTAAAVTAQDGDPAATGTVAAAGFSGSAADGRTLPGLMYLPVLTVKAQIAAGTPLAQALDAGSRQLALLVSSEVTQAGRDAAQAAMTATPAVHGYVRMVSGAACSRCIILAGKSYRWNASFQRHPHCGCTGIPALENRPGHLTTSPHAFFDHLSVEQQNLRFGAADAQAIREGADMFQVVNARRGMYTTTVFGRDIQATTEGMTRRGIAAQRLAASGAPRGLRLTVAQIYADAGEDRDLALALLRRNAYII